MKKFLAIAFIGILTACSDYHAEDQAHYHQDNWIYAKCKELGYVVGTTPFKECKMRLMHTFEHEPYTVNEYSLPVRR